MRRLIILSARLLIGPAVAATIFLALIPSDVKLPNALSTHTINHVFAFLVFTVLLTTSYPPIKNSVAISLGLAFGVSIELAQLLITDDRTPSFIDLLYDLVGITVGTLVVRLMLSLADFRRSHNQ